MNALSVIHISSRLFWYFSMFFYRMILCSIAQDNLVNILMDALISSSVSSVLWPFFQTFVRKLYQR